MCVFACTCICVCVCVYVYMYVYAYVRVCVYVHAWMFKHSLFPCNYTIKCFPLYPSNIKWDSVHVRLPFFSRSGPGLCNFPNRLYPPLPTENDLFYNTACFYGPFYSFGAYTRPMPLSQSMLDWSAAGVFSFENNIFP